jgi:hypothetical protein
LDGITMDTSPLSSRDLLTHVINDMARAVSVRPGETGEQHIIRSKVAIQTVIAFSPRDVIETQLAGRCMMFHELTTDAVRETLRGEAGAARRATRQNIVALDHCFGENLARLERYMGRTAQGDLPAALAKTSAANQETGTQDPARPETKSQVRTRKQAATPPIPLPDFEPEPALEGPARFFPTAEAIATCRSNPAAMAALRAGDPAAFARALGIEPNEAFLAAATRPGSPFAPRPKAARSEDQGEEPDVTPSRTTGNTNLP